jgi:hypothetical protein
MTRTTITVNIELDHQQPRLLIRNLGQTSKLNGRAPRRHQLG